MITTFYSYKGGVGRSLALLHVAWRVAALRQEMRILVVDLDLEAPSLDASFLPQGASPKGFAGLIVEAAGVADAELDAWVRERVTQSEAGFVSVGGPEGKRPNLTYLSSGLGPQAPADAPPYSQVTQRLRAELVRVETDPPRLPEEAFLGAFRKTLATEFDYVFIDSRTGLADEAWLNTVLLPDALVLLFRLDLASLGGMPEVLGNYLNRADTNTISTDPTIKVIPVLGMAPARGGPDIPDWIDRHASWLITRDEPKGLNQRRDAPLSRRSPLFRIPRDPWFEVDNPKIVNNKGMWIRGFDDGEPVSVGLQALTNAILNVNFAKDAQSAETLWDLATDEYDSDLALAYFKCWVETDPRECDHPLLSLLGDERKAWEELRPIYLRNTESGNPGYAAASAVALARHEPLPDHAHWLRRAMEHAPDDPLLAMKVFRAAKFELPLLSGEVVARVLVEVSNLLRFREVWMRLEEEALVRWASRTGQVAVMAVVMSQSDKPAVRALGEFILTSDFTNFTTHLTPLFGAGDRPVIEHFLLRSRTLSSLTALLAGPIPDPQNTGHFAAAYLRWALDLTGQISTAYQSRTEPVIGASWIALSSWIHVDPSINELAFLEEPTIERLTDQWLLPRLADVAFKGNPMEMGPIFATLESLTAHAPAFATTLRSELSGARLTLETLAARGRFPAENLRPLQPLWDWADNLPDPQPVPPWDPKDGLPVDDMVATWEILCRLCKPPQFC